MMLRFFCAVLLVFNLTTGSVSADVNDELQGIREEIKTKKQLLKKTRKVETKVSSELEQMEKSLREKEANLRVLNRELKSVETGLGHTQQEIEQVKKEADRKREQIRKRLSALYKAGELGEARMFFSSETLPQLIENRRYMKAVVDNDRRLFADYQQKIGQLQKLRTSLEQEAVRKERLQERIRQKRQEVETEKTKKTSYLGKIRQEKKGYLASLRELEANARRLQTMVERLEARTRKSYTSKNDKKSRVTSESTLPPISDKGFGAQRGRLALPAVGHISSRFGKQKHPEFNSYTVNNGITIDAPLNSEFRSVYDGQIIFADRFKGYGNMMIVDHGGGFFSLYAHAASLHKKVGATTGRNEVLGTVGDSDSSLGPRLYFEIRFQGRPVDPAIWFR